MLPTSNERPTRAGGQAAHILVVDDDETLRELIHYALKSSEWEVALAHDGRQALSLLQWEHYNLAIVDLRLPDMGGLELIRRVKEQSPDTEAVILSADGDLETAVQALRLGACDYLSKPLDDLPLLTATVQRVLDRQELRLANRYLVDELQRAQGALRRQRRRELRRLEEVGIALAGALQTTDALDVLKRAASAALRCDVLALYLFNPQLNGPSLRVYSEWPLHDGLLEDLRQAASETGIEPVTLERAGVNAEVTVLAAKPSPAPAAFGTIAASPLAVHAASLGLVVVAAERANAFAPEELQLLRILCNQAAVAVENARLFDQAQFLAARDGLTGLLNHRSFYQRLEEEISRSRRHGLPLSLIILDIDCLRRINDRYGHLAGDELLRVFAQVILSTVRRSDIVARYGGDEFAVLLPHTTPEAAAALCERLRRHIEAYRFAVGSRIEQLGASFGVAGLDAPAAEAGTEMVRRADQALYRAKMAGKNQVALA